MCAIDPEELKRIVKKDEVWAAYIDSLETEKETKTVETKGNLKGRNVTITDKFEITINIQKKCDFLPLTQLLNQPSIQPIISSETKYAKLFQSTLKKEKL